MAVSYTHLDVYKRQGIGSLLGHDTLPVCYIIAGRQNLNMNTNYKQGIDGLIELVLERI